MAGGSEWHLCLFLNCKLNIFLCYVLLGTRHLILTRASGCKPRGDGDDDWTRFASCVRGELPVEFIGSPLQNESRFSVRFPTMSFPFSLSPPKGHLCSRYMGLQSVSPVIFYGVYVVSDRRFFMVPEFLVRSLMHHPLVNLTRSRDISEKGRPVSQVGNGQRVRNGVGAAVCYSCGSAVFAKAIF